MPKPGNSFEPYNHLDPSEPSYIDPQAANDDLNASFHSSQGGEEK